MPFYISFIAHLSHWKWRAGLQTWSLPGHWRSDLGLGASYSKNHCQLLEHGGFVMEDAQEEVAAPVCEDLYIYLTTWGPLWTSLKRYELLTLGWSICPSLFPIQLILSGFVHTNLRSHAKFQVKILISYSCSFHEKFNTEIPMSNYPKTENWQKRG